MARRRQVDANKRLESIRKRAEQLYDHASAAADWPEARNVLGLLRSVEALWLRNSTALAKAEREADTRSDLIEIAKRIQARERAAGASSET